MKLKLQLTRAIAVSLCCAAGFGFVVFLMDEWLVLRLDQAVTDFIQSRRSPALTGLMRGVTAVGEVGAVLAIMLLAAVILYKWLHHRRELLLLLWVVAGSMLLNAMLKLLFQRERPTISRLIEVNGFSFPSGHSMAAFSLFAVIAFLLWKHIDSRLGRGLVVLLSMMMILAIGVSRIYLGVHYPSDVLAGYLASGCWMTASVWYYQRYMDKSASK
ncbi:hypothetical protein PAESOLCIP111_00442 [Paenibacillus solanacearum]|uniref:Phosphatidic acid phosphatase type 2/haloperoxidase domain-containing protein n=1 Tax=Paenibacillus solanacearum TaxID=2048548 RepID=A0A916JSY2_9BACL|nr:phosphatase PAP2 family protein [Paenibacillus solanacearum]CAG7600970.1 hypothetical protein PAESOLCIP111_00442 [Paenibacillus solanacearum]